MLDAQGTRVAQLHLEKVAVRPARVERISNLGYMPGYFARSRVAVFRHRRAGRHYGQDRHRYCHFSSKQPQRAPGQKQAHLMASPYAARLRAAPPLRTGLTPRPKCP